MVSSCLWLNGMIDVVDDITYSFRIKGASIAITDSQLDSWSYLSLQLVTVSELATYVETSTFHCQLTACDSQMNTSETQDSQLCGLFWKL